MPTVLEPLDEFSTVEPGSFDATSTVLAIANDRPRGVELIDAKDGTVDQTIPVEGCPLSLQFDTDNHLWMLVGCSGSGEDVLLYRIDLGSGEATSTFDIGNGYSKILEASADEIAVAGEVTGSAVKVATLSTSSGSVTESTVSVKVRSTAPGQAIGFNSLVAMGDGEMWLASNSGSKLHRISQDGGSDHVYDLPAAPDRVFWAPEYNQVLVAMTDDTVGLLDATADPETAEVSVIEMDPIDVAAVASYVDSDECVSGVLLLGWPGEDSMSPLATVGLTVSGPVRSTSETSGIDLGPEPAFGLLSTPGKAWLVGNTRTVSVEPPKGCAE